MTTLTEMLEALSEEDRQQVELLTEEFRAEARTWRAAENKKRAPSAESSAPATLAEQHTDSSEKDMPKRSNSHHIVPHPEGGWDVKRAGASRSSGHFDTKKEAEDAGRQISRNQGTELTIHGVDGKIQRRDSHGNDPYPPKG